MAIDCTVVVRPAAALVGSSFMPADMAFDADTSQSATLDLQRPGL